MLGMEMQKSLKIKNKYNFRETTLVRKSTVKTSSLILFKLFTKKKYFAYKSKNESNFIISNRTVKLLKFRMSKTLIKMNESESFASFFLYHLLKLYLHRLSSSTHCRSFWQHQIYKLEKFQLQSFGFCKSALVCKSALSY